MARTVTNILQTVITIVKKGGGDKEAIKGLADIKRVAGDVAMVAGVVAAAWYTVDKVLDATVGTFIAYADEVERVMNLTGASAEEASKLIQAADDLGISTETVTKSLQFMAKNGLEPTIEGLAQLADEYTALEPGSERTSFLLEKMGKSSGDMAKLLKLGGEGVREWAASIDGALVLTEESIRKAHEYELAQDALNDSWTEFKVSVGEKVTPTLTTLLNHINALNEADQRLTEEGIQPNTKAWFDRRSELIESIKAEQEQQNALRETAAVAEDAAEAIEEIDYKGMLDMTLDLQSGFDDFNQKQDEVNQKLRELEARFQAGEIKVDDYNDQYAELTGQLDKNAKAHELWAKKTIFSMLQARLAVDGFSEGEFNFLIQVGEQMGLVDEATATMAQGINDSLDSIDFSNVQGYSQAWQQLLNMPHNQIFTITTVQQATLDLINQGVPPTVASQVTGNKSIDRSFAGGAGNYINVENLNLSGDKLSVGAFLAELGLAITL